ncbi:hypothetical protein VTH06DRAFT_1352 [Thermothelomyces fergusii]
MRSISAHRNGLPFHTSLSTNAATLNLLPIHLPYCPFARRNVVLLPGSGGPGLTDFEHDGSRWSHHCQKQFPGEPTNTTA